MYLDSQWKNWGSGYIEFRIAHWEWLDAVLRYKRRGRPCERSRLRAWDCTVTKKLRIALCRMVDIVQNCPQLELGAWNYPVKISHRLYGYKSPLRSLGSIWFSIDLLLAQISKASSWERPQFPCICPKRSRWKKKKRVLTYSAWHLRFLQYAIFSESKKTAS